MLGIAFGTRPEWLKIKPLVEQLKLNNIEYKIIFTGQHDSLIERDRYFDRKIRIVNGKNRLDSVFCSILNTDEIFEQITSVIVQGDTASAFAVALAAFHRKIKVIHLEAGLRSFDIENPYPEEFYRKAISALANINFCVSEVGETNLKDEKVSGEIYTVGNTVLDNIPNLEIEYGNKILVTMHRRENHDMMKEWFHSLEKLAEQNKNLEFILPIHPNPNVKKHKKILKNVKVVDPLSHKELLDIISKCLFVITDSGGLQEESSFLKKKSIVCRKTTERVEGLETFSFLCESPKNLEVLFNNLLKNYYIDLPCPYGDGKSSIKIVEILKKVLDNGSFRV